MRSQVTWAAIIAAIAFIAGVWNFAAAVRHCPAAA
jgi:hypothetical protein